MKYLLMTFFVIATNILLSQNQTNSYVVGSSTSDTKAKHIVPNDKMWSITSIGEGGKILTDSFVIAYMGTNSAILVGTKGNNESILMNLPIVLSPGGTYEFVCDKGSLIYISEYENK